MKTISLKKVAVVAVASLGFGVFTSIPAANAAKVNSTLTVDAISVTTPTQTVTVGTAVTSTFGLSFTAAGDGTLFGSADLSLTKPTGSVVTLADKTGSTGGLIGTNGSTTGTTTFPTDANAGDHVKFIPANLAAAADTHLAGTLGFTPDRPGTYVVTITGNTLGSPATANAVTATMTVIARSLAYTTGDGAAVAPFSTGNGIAGPFNTVTVTAHSTQVANVRALVTVDGAGATISSGGTVAADFKSTTVAAANNAAIVIKTPNVGTVTVNLYNETAASSGLFSPTAANTVTITVGAAALNGTISVANSTSLIDGTIASDNAAWSTISADEVALVTAEASATLERAVIKVVLKDTLTNLMPDATGISATISGPGLLAIGTTQPSSAVGRAVSSTTLASGTGTAFISVYSDGTEGVGTITISVGTTTVATETVSFYGKAAKYVAVVKKQHIANSGSSTADVIEVTATDKAGNLVPSSVIGASVGTSTIATVASSATTASTGKALFAMTGLATKFGAVVVTFADSATAPTVTTTATVGVSSPLAKTVTAAADKTTYTAGAPITWTLTFKDANGLGIPDGQYAAGTLLANAAANPVASAALASTPFKGDVAVDVVAGVATAKGFAPLTAGPVSYVWTLGGTAGAADSANLVTALQATTVTASATVTDASAAIQTSIAALNAKIVALNALIAKIMKRLNIR